MLFALQPNTVFVPSISSVGVKTKNERGKRKGEGIDEKIWKEKTTLLAFKGLHQRQKANSAWRGLTDIRMEGNKNTKGESEVCVDKCVIHSIKVVREGAEREKDHVCICLKHDKCDKKAGYK